LCNFGCSASWNSRAILRLAASPAVFIFRQSCLAGLCRLSLSRATLDFAIMASIE
jgi:hypothetical protein